jgi:hypothetical protein
MWRIEFSSSKFSPILPEECQGNPGAYGFELAWWLAQALSKRGVHTSYPLGEDWGWFIEYFSESEMEFMIGCRSAALSEGYNGKPIEWDIFIRPYMSIKDRLKGNSHAAEVERLGAHIIEALEADQVQVVRNDEA